VAEPVDQGERAAGASAFLFGRGAVYTVARASQLLAALVVTPLVTRQLSTGAYGTLATASRVSQVVAVVVGLGLPAGLVRIYFDGRGHDRARRLVASTFLVALAMALVVHLTGPWWSALFRGLPYGAALTAAVWLAVPVCMLEASQGILRAKDDASGFVIAAMTASAGGQLVGLVVVARGGGAAGYLIAVAVVTALAAVLATARAGVFGQRPAAWADVDEALRLGGPTVPHLLAMLVILVGDRVVIERLLGLADVGRYELAYQVGSLALVLVTSVNNAWAPMIYGAAEEDRWQILRVTTASVDQVTAPMIGVLCFAGPFALRILAPASYDLQGLKAVIAVVAGATIAYVHYLANVHIVFQQRRTVVLAWSTPLAAVVNVVAAMAFVRWWGLVGGAAATVVAYAVLALLTNRTARRCATVPWDVPTALRSFALVGAFVAAGALLPDIGAPWILARAVGAAGALVLFGVALRRVTASGFTT